MPNVSSEILEKKLVVVVLMLMLMLLLLLLLLSLLLLLLLSLSLSLSLLLLLLLLLLLSSYSLARSPLRRPGSADIYIILSLIFSIILYIYI